jgi:hypothetical protein
MTAITFPLKKFPGQFSHRSMVFTGRASAHVIILVVSALLHGFIIQALQVRRLLDALLCSLPLICSWFFHITYLLKVRLEDADYFSMSLNMLKERYEEDSRYFDKVCALGLFLSASSLTFALMKHLRGSLLTPLLTASNACLLLIMYHVSLYKGLYTNKRIAAYVLLVAFIETAFIAASLSGMYMASFTILFTAAAYLFYERSKGNSLYGLLQNVIK